MKNKYLEKIASYPFYPHAFVLGAGIGGIVGNVTSNSENKLKNTLIGASIGGPLGLFEGIRRSKFTAAGKAIDRADKEIDYLKRKIKEAKNKYS